MHLSQADLLSPITTKTQKITCVTKFLELNSRLESINSLSQVKLKKH